MRDGSAPKFRLADGLAALLVFSATLVAFWPATHNAFVSWDDYANLRDNPHFRGFGGEQLRWMFTALHYGHYQPVTWLTFALDDALDGPKLASVHQTNVVLHAINAVVFFLLARAFISLRVARHASRASASLTAGATAAALVFALHPLRVESVAWATERRDLVSAFFAMLAVLAYLRANAPAAVSSRWRWMALCVVLFALGSLAKVIVTLLPVVLIFIDVWPLGRRMKGLGVWVEKLPFVAISLIVGYVGIAAARDVDALKSIQSYGLLERVLQFFYSLAFYVQKTLLPIDLAPLYELPKRIDLSDVRFAASAVVAVGISVGLVLFRKRWPAGLAAWVCYIVWLLPVSGLAQNGPQITADRYSYLACMGFAMLVGAGVIRAIRWNRQVGVAVVVTCGVAGVALGSLAYRQTAVWRNSATLWARVLKVDPKSSVAENGLGQAILEDATIRDPVERYRRAIVHFKRAIELDPDSSAANLNLGIALHETGSLFDAELRLRHAVAVHPNEATRAELGRLLVDLNRPKEAVAEYAAAMRDAKAHHAVRFEIVYGYGIALHAAGRYADAIKQYAAAERLRPGEARVPANRCLAHIMLGQLDEAAAELKRAQRIAPKNPVVVDAAKTLAKARERAATRP